MSADSLIWQAKRYTCFAFVVGALVHISYAAHLCCWQRHTHTHTLTLTIRSHISHARTLIQRYAASTLVYVVRCAHHRYVVQSTKHNLTYMLCIYQIYLHQRTEKLDLFLCRKNTIKLLSRKKSIFSRCAWCDFYMQLHSIISLILWTHQKMSNLKIRIIFSRSNWIASTLHQMQCTISMQNWRFIRINYFRFRSPIWNAWTFHFRSPLFLFELNRAELANTMIYSGSLSHNKLAVYCTQIHNRPAAECMGVFFRISSRNSDETWDLMPVVLVSNFQPDRITLTWRELSPKFWNRCMGLKIPVLRGISHSLAIKSFFFYCSDKIRFYIVKFIHLPFQKF